jgi:tRNA threonylcarbamoyladenosine biosynthesis protein TsaB
MHTLPCILAFDTATGPASVAVWKNGAIAAYLEITASTMQSARLVPMIEQALKESKTSYKQLTAVACTIGPGSFTGIRTGLATARGIRLAAGIKGLGFNTLDVMAFSAQKQKPETPILAILSAGKGEYYYQGFDRSSPRFSPHIGKTTDAVTVMGGNFVTVGNITIPDIPSLPVSFPRADALVELAATRPEAAPLKPFYIRSPDATPLVKTGEALL